MQTQTQTQTQSIDKLIIDDLKRDEGFRQHVYKDHLGYWTIGIGRMVDERKHGGITMEEAMYLLSNDVQCCLVSLKNELEWFDASPPLIKRALVNMAFQMGIGSADEGTGLLGFKNTLRLIALKQYEEAANNALKSKWAKQTPERAKRVTDWIRQAGRDG